MSEIWAIIVLHQIVFQGMFALKNILLKLKTGEQIRGKNIEATLSIAFFILFVGVTLAIAYFDPSFGLVNLVDGPIALAIGFALLGLNLLISIASLVGLRDSWRVGVIENQKTELVTTGIYQFSRNPYFASYLIMFAAYTTLMQNIILLILSLIGFLFIHKMIMKEERYLTNTHGGTYLAYKKKAPRYIFPDILGQS
ncbi:MAG: isoprenylcysteine carboxylmethyltransferase family protein [Rhodospirillales bacterium]|nr:isoprenylcysteine carboxylmethyltransferase family protein [Rhodospirillales bacterium]